VDIVTVSLFDLTGRLISQTETHGAAGLGINGRQSYEHALDISSLASGTYIYTVRTQKGGQSVYKRNKFAVVK
jgi:hypothetical protein